MKFSHTTIRYELVDKKEPHGYRYFTRNEISRVKAFCDRLNKNGCWFEIYSPDLIDYEAFLRMNPDGTTN